MTEFSSHAWCVLLVDDDEDDYILTRTMLNSAEGQLVRLEWASSYKLGLTALQSKPFDAVIVDYDLGGKTGIDLVRAAIQAGQSAPFILYTSRGTATMDVEAMQAGATLTLTKQGASSQLLVRSIQFAIERRQADLALQHSERRWRLLAEAMPNPVWTCDPAGRCDYLSRQWTEFTGRSEAEQLGYGWLAQVHPDDRDELMAEWQRSVALGESLDRNIRLRRYDGTYRWFKTRAIPVREETGGIVRWYGTSTDIDDLVQAEAVLQQSRADLEVARGQAETEKRRLEAVLEALPVGVAITNAQGGGVEFNSAFGQIWSGPYPNPESVKDYGAFLGWWVDTGLPVQPEEWASAQAVLHGRKVVDQMIEIRRFDGSSATIINSAAPVRDASGNIIGGAVAIQDITALRQAEQKLLASEQKYRGLFNSMSEAVLLVDVDLNSAGEVVDCQIMDLNPAYERLTGIPREEHIGMRGKEFADHFPYFQEITRALQTSLPQELELTARLTNKRLAVTILPMGEKQVAGIVIDVTARMQAEAALREREAELQLIMAATPALMSYIDTNFRYRRINENFTRWFNRPLEDMQGRFVWEVLGAAAWERVRPRMERALRGEMVTYEEKLPYISGDRWVHVDYIPHRDEDGKVRGLVTHVVDLEEQKSLEAMLDDALDRAMWLARLPGENPNPVARVSSDGTVLFCNPAAADPAVWGLEVDAPLPGVIYEAARKAGTQASVVKDDVAAAGRVYALTAMPFPADGYVNLYGVDVTERIQAEAALMDYTKRLQRSNRALEDFAFIASHDMQEPLRKITAFGDLLKTRYVERLDERGLDYIERMQEAARRMQSMIQGLLDYARVDTQEQELTQVDLSATARDVLSDLEVRLLRSQGRVDLRDLPVVEADAMQMRQLLMNLIGNALKFHKPDSPPLVQVSAEILEDEWLELRVADNGVGIPLQNSKNLFMPFGRMHGRSQFEGTGMGLAICRKIAENHGGTIGVESVLDQGTTVVVRLPLKHRYPASQG